MGTMGESTSLWVFGYGSLVWKPGFKYGQAKVGSVTGFARRFWQGNETHRGVPGSPGRVATLVEEMGVVTFGLALELTGEEALDYLNNREVALGGYNQHITMFQPADSTSAFPVLVYVATPTSGYWLGPAPPHEIAEQVVRSSGPAGHNVEYVLRLAEWVHDNLPEVKDDHLFDIETHVRIKVKERNLCMKTLMGEKEEVVAAAEERRRLVEDDDSHRRDTFAAHTGCAKCGLRCVKL